MSSTMPVTQVPLMDAWEGIPIRGTHTPATNYTNLDVKDFPREARQAAPRMAGHERCCAECRARLPVPEAPPEPECKHADVEQAKADGYVVSCDEFASSISYRVIGSGKEHHDFVLIGGMPTCIKHPLQGSDGKKIGSRDDLIHLIRLVDTCSTARYAYNITSNREITARFNTLKALRDELGDPSCTTTPYFGRM